MEMEFIDENRTSAIIKVVGVGGCGGNAVRNMCANHEIEQVAYYAVNTDAQALDSMPSGVERIQIGQSTGRGLGAGADYSLAEKAAREDEARLRKIIDGADMVFVAAGMGGGTGTGAAPVIAELCQEQKILTVAVVTKPFGFENRDAPAEVGIDNLNKQVDSVIIVPNDKVLEHFGEDVKMDEIFQRSDEVLINAVSGICEVIAKPGHINVDFADVRSVMSAMGRAMMGTALEEGPARAVTAATKVIECPLLEGIDLLNARGLLVNISASKDSLSFKEVNEAMNLIKPKASPEAKVFFGIVYDDTLGEKMRITLIATGLRSESGLRRLGGGTHIGAAARPAMFRSARMKKGNLNQQSLLDEDDRMPAVLRKQLS